MSEDTPRDVLLPLPKWGPAPGERHDPEYCLSQLEAWTKRLFAGDEMLDHEFGRVMYYLPLSGLSLTVQADIQWRAHGHLKQARLKTALKWIAKFRDSMFCHALPEDCRHYYVEAFIEPYFKCADADPLDLGTTPRELALFKLMRGGVLRHIAWRQAEQRMLTDADALLNNLLGRDPPEGDPNCPK